MAGVWSLEESKIVFVWLVRRRRRRCPVLSVSRPRMVSIKFIMKKALAIGICILIGDDVA